MAEVATITENPSELVDKTLKEQHREAFNAAAFGIDNDGNVIDASKMKDYKSQKI